ncbi:DUF5666 domain-containing protein [Ideonella sp. DXS29W]|uniref:DUF5666 domain-containing protein n=1 Tax=Ideonella lacteola TaxID=2984193 RepID=A0ABU9BVR6_9BURK
MTSLFSSIRLAWRRGHLAAALLAVALLHACGGGVEGQGTGSVSYSEGPIAGFGSIIVNGIHFDESSATITDDDGHALTRADLKLGMTVRVDSGAIDQTLGTAVAREVRIGSDLIGPVEANDLTAKTLQVLGQTVRITASTVFDDAITGGQGGVGVGDKVEIFAIFDPVAGSYAAQRIEPAGEPTSYKLRGTVSALDTVQRTFKMGPATLTYSAGAAPADLANGQLLRVSLQTSIDGSGRWVVSQFANGASTPVDGGEAEIESVIASYTSNADFVISGVRVNASSARIEPAGATLAAGVRVEVEGTMQGGVLMADEVKVKGSGDDDGDDEGREVELKGDITALDTAAKTMVVRGQTIDYASATFSGDLGESDLAVGRQVEVHGTLSSDGTYVVAEEIEIDD